MTGRGVEWVQLWDGRRWPGRVSGGLPEFGFKQAPSGLSTRRQLRERGLSPGRQEPFARLTWKKDQRFAWLYVDAKARPKRTPSDKQLAAVDKALAARKVCAECGPVEHFVRTTDQLCGDCHAAGVTPTAGGTGGWRTFHAWQETDTDTDDAGQADDQGVGEVDGPDRQVDRGGGSEDGQEASAAAGRAAEALARTTAHLHATEQLRGTADRERDEQLARWHADDQSARLTAEQAGTNDGQDWARHERGVA